MISKTIEAHRSLKKFAHEYCKASITNTDRAEIMVHDIYGKIYKIIEEEFDLIPTKLRLMELAEKINSGIIRTPESRAEETIKTYKSLLSAIVGDGGNND